MNYSSQEIVDNVERYGFCPKIEGLNCPKNAWPCEIRPVLEAEEKIIEDETHPDVYDREMRNDCWNDTLAQAYH